MRKYKYYDTYFHGDHEYQKYEKGKKISYEIIELVLVQKEKKGLKEMLWRKYIEDEEFDESEKMELTEEQKEELENEVKYYDHCDSNNILSILSFSGEKELLKIYCEKMIQKREGKIQKELESEKEDKNMYLVSISTDYVDDSKYILEIIRKNPGKIKYMTYILQSVYEQMEVICNELQKKGEREKVEKILEEVRLEQLQEKEYKKLQLKEGSKELLRDLIQQKEVFDEMIKLKCFFQIYQKLYTNLDGSKTMYVNAVHSDVKYVQKKLLEKFEKMCKEKDKCAICLEQMSQFSTKLKMCEECVNYYHEKCAKKVQRCPMCKEKLW